MAEIKQGNLRFGLCIPTEQSTPAVAQPAHPDRVGIVDTVVVVVAAVS